MAIGYSLEVLKELGEEFHEAALHRPMRVERYDPGTELVYDITGVGKPHRGRTRLLVESFVGGGFAGQVYRVKLLGIECEDGPIQGLDAGGIYAAKVLIPPGSFSRLFRDALYWIGFQGPFQPQVNPAAARAAALWQKFIRRGAKIRFGDERAVVDIHATFVDHTLGGCGELREWVEGRTWRLEVDDRMDLLRQWDNGIAVDVQDLGSPEYRAKREFMREFVDLLHDMGGHELARQYEWSTWKSQPNCLKREEADDSSSRGLVAVDFKAGLVLLPFLPMSPGDFRLIAKGVARGSLVQFDRGDVGKLEEFVEAHGDQFADMPDMLQELKTSEQTYRDSIPDITRNHIRILSDSHLRSTIRESMVTGWKVRKLVDDVSAGALRGNKALMFLFFVIGTIPGLGRILRRMWARPDWRSHYCEMLTSWNYLRRALRAKIAERTIVWHREGRVDGARALKITKQMWRFFFHVPLAVLPAGLHRFMTDKQYAKDRLINLLVRPVRLYFDEGLRAQWLRDMVTEGMRKHLLSDEDAGVILSQIKEPFIQKYLKSLAVHICFSPTTHVVALVVAITYIMMHPEMSRAQAWAVGVGIMALFQVIPISPGSLARGSYVLYLIIRERNFRDYSVALSLAFFKYIGYLAFPTQMTYRYPALARFMAGYWSTEMVHVVPVFGERGALLEYKVFCLFYNWPLTIRRRMLKRAEMRLAIASRYWHIAVCALAGSAIFELLDIPYLVKSAHLAGVEKIWWLAILVAMLCGIAVTLFAGGAKLWKRIVAGAICGCMVAVLTSAVSWILCYSRPVGVSEIATSSLWRFFLFTFFSTIGVLLTELRLPEPMVHNVGHNSTQ